ncbi:MAG TPA: LamG-like jellyroll fold domain-containing protein [Planctomycetota bacterium]|nr:LamG-like jellyroll fold domain-containing protein [Planctomycetota bacterium]
MNTCSHLAVLLLSVSLLPAQDLLHYKFDEHCGDEVINFAAGSPVGNATMHSTLPGGTTAARIPGQFGDAMSATIFPLGPGTTYLNTTWPPNTVTGNLSFAMWIRNPPGNPAAIAFGYLFGASGTSANFRLFTGSSGKMFLAGLPNSVTSAVDLTPLLNAGWVHIACTVDSAALQAIWYINGVADPAVTLTAPVAILGTDFTIGARANTGSNPSPLDTDEFLLSQNVWTPAEVLALASAPRAGDGDYASGITAQCGAGNISLGSSGGPPAVGNLGYTLEVSATAPSLFLLLAGFDKCTFGGAIPLPLDGTPILPLLSGCWILADAPVILNGVVAVGPTPMPLPIPATTPVATNVYTQALGIDLNTFATSMSSGFATSTGQ